MTLLPQALTPLEEQIVGKPNTLIETDLLRRSQKTVFAALDGSIGDDFDAWVKETLTPPE